VVAAPAAAAAQDADEFPGAELFYDAGAIGFVYAPLALVATAELAFDPPLAPRWFSDPEADVPEFKNTVPELYVGVGGALLATGLFVTKADGRWFHVKGMAQSITTTLAISSLAKNVFGRRRPHWTSESIDRDHRRSFPSSHASTTFSLSTYGCLFLHRDGELGRVRTPLCAGLAAVAGLVAYSRVIDRRHHRSDVLAGALLGVVTSTGFFVWQESRYSRATGAAEPGESTGFPLGLGWAGSF
jgi:membrane-associated phospholipid phosphatase